jgi:hypothetical protein
MSRFPELDALIPWNTIQRRNVSILYAYAAGCDPIITIDDDNLVYDGVDFIGQHLAGFSNEPTDVLSSSSGWFNICRFLRDKRGYNFYPRGYPLDERWKNFLPATSAASKPVRVAVNAGLWLDDPDVDAITRLTNDIVAVEYTRERSFALAAGTWCPFNSQNTAISRAAVAAYVLPPHIGRYDDIWISYVVLRMCDHLGVRSVPS